MQEADGSLCLVDNIRSEHPVKRVLLPAAQEQDVSLLCVCENGDHVFFTKGLSYYSGYQISGVRIQGGKENIDEEHYHYKFTVLEY